MKRPCLTPEAVYKTIVTRHRITMTVNLPPQVNLCVENELEDRHGTIESRVHDAMEWVLGPWFFHAVSARRTELVRKTGWPDFHLTPEETTELARLSAYVDNLAAFSETPSDNESMNLIRRAAKLIRERASGAVVAGLSREVVR